MFKKFNFGRALIILAVIFIFGSSFVKIFNQMIYLKQLDAEIEKTKQEIEYYKKQNELLENPEYAKEFLRTKYLSEEGEIIYIFPPEEQVKE